MADYISREEVLKAMEADIELDKLNGRTDWRFTNARSRSISVIKEVPAADVKPVTRGHWDGNAYPVCSECRKPALSEKINLRVVDEYYDFDGMLRFYKSVSYDTVYRKTDFCPHCGAKMVD